MLCPYGFVGDLPWVRRQLWIAFGQAISPFTEVKRAGPSKGTLDESLWDSRDGPGATKSYIAGLGLISGAYSRN
jgi:hypothetical protein